MSYLVQPVLESASPGHNMLRSSEPDPDHPFLTALANSFDVGTPFLWRDGGAFCLDMTASAQMLPAPTRRLAVKELSKLVVRWNDQRRVGLDVGLLLTR